MLKVVDAGSLGSIMGQPGSFKPLIDAGSHLYLQKMFELENRFTGALKAKLVIPAEPQFGQKIEAALHDVLSKPAVSAQTGKPVQLNDEQQQAVRMAVQNAVSIISGGPGTGKTNHRPLDLTRIATVGNQLPRNRSGCTDWQGG